MLDSLKRKPGSLRWPPRQRFSASERGRQAHASYQDEIRSLHATGRQNRQDLEKVQAAWAQTFQVRPDDALILGELLAKDRLPREVLGALEDCGASLQDIQAAIDRLYLAGLVETQGGVGPLAPNATEPN